MNENWTKFIELFLQGELSPEDRAKLQAELDRNPEMYKSLEQQKLIHEAAKRSGERELVKNVQKSYRFQRTVKTSIISVIAATAIATLSYFAYQAFEKKRNPQIESGEAVIEGKYQELDKQAELDNLPIAYFEHNGKAATYLSPKGILLSVPENTFVLDGKPYKGKAVIQFQEALEAGDIMKAGLSTMSGDRLLETQGMFQLKAFTPDGKRLTVNDKDGIYLQVPVDENKAGMQLFDGVKNANGEIDWQNPKPIEKLPIQANMLDLDFFPPGFEPKLDELKWKQGKKQRDSLYLSFEELDNSTKASRPSNSKSGFLELYCEPKFGNKISGSILAYPDELLRLNKLKISVKFDSKMTGTFELEGMFSSRLPMIQENVKDYFPLNLDNSAISILKTETKFYENKFKTIYNFQLLTKSEIKTLGTIDMTRFTISPVYRGLEPKYGISFF
jgi:hypothetical protein